MIAQIKGLVIDIFEKGAVIDLGTLAYNVFTPASLTLGQEVTLFTHLVIREDAQELYGFQTKEEKTLFNSLISVSGVGPKMALQIFLLYPTTEIVRAIQNSDSKTISLVPGIGKKTAEKIIIDLRDKLKDFKVGEETGSGDLVEALISLGFRDYDIRNILTEVDPTLALEKQIMLALQILNK